MRLAEECRADGILIDAALVVEHVPGSRYLAILDNSGDLAVAVSDMRALDCLTPAVLQDRRVLLGSADLVVADTNLSEESLVWLARECSAALLVDPVSAAKAVRVAEVLHDVHTLKLNALEAGALLGRNVDPASNTDVARAVGELLSRGVKRVFLTRGPLGVFAQDAGATVTFDAPVVDTVNATGAGDAFTAGVAFSMLQGMPLADSAAFGSAMAAAALSSARTVNESITLAGVRSSMKEMLS